MHVDQLIKSENASGGILGSSAALSYMTWGCEPLFCSLSTECLMIQPFNTTTPDNNLDVIISLLAFGVYPNVCYHKEKRKILSAEVHNALIHKSSVNCPFSSQDIKYPSPFFVFGEKVKTLNLVLSVSCQVAQEAIFGKEAVRKKPTLCNIQLGFGVLGGFVIGVGFFFPRK